MKKMTDEEKVKMGQAYKEMGLINQTIESEFMSSEGSEYLKKGEKQL